MTRDLTDLVNESPPGGVEIPGHHLVVAGREDGALPLWHHLKCRRDIVIGSYLQ